MRLNNDLLNEDSPLGQLPYLTIDGLKLPQSISIARFVAKRFNLYGSDDLEQAKTDAIVDTVSDLQSGYFQKVFLAKEEDKDAARKSFLAEDAPNHLGKLEKLITLWGSNGHSVGSSLKWSDLFIYDVTNALSSMDANLVSKFPAIHGVVKSVEANQKVSEYVKNRPVTPF